MAGDVVLTDEGVEIQGDLKASANVKVVGDLQAKTISYTWITPNLLLGRSVLGTEKRQLRIMTRDLLLTWERFNAQGSLEPVIAGDDPSKSNIALSHLEGNKLGLNRGGGYSGGTLVEGALEVTGSLIVGGMDIVAEIKKLKAK